MNEYATLEQIRGWLTSENVPMSRSDDDKLRQYLTFASRRIDRHCHRKFYPRLETRRYDYQSSRELVLDDDLLMVGTLTTASGTTISASDYYLYPLNGTPKYKIYIDTSKSAIFDYTGTPQQAINVNDSTWGWHDEWSDAWLDSQDEVEDDPLSSSATTLTVNDPDGADFEGITPRFSVGQLLKIGSEYLVVTDTNAGANELTVRRGVNGTTAAEHAQNTTISVYRPAEIVTTATLALGKLLYETRSAVGGLIALPSLEGAALRAEIERVLAEYALPVRPTNLVRFS